MDFFKITWGSYMVSILGPYIGSIMRPYMDMKILPPQQKQQHQQGHGSLHDQAAFVPVKKKKYCIISN